MGTVHHGKKEAYVKCENCLGVVKLSMVGTGNLCNEIDGPQHPPPTKGVS